MVSELDLVQDTLVTQRLELHDDSPILKDANFTNPYRVLVDFQGPLRWRVPQVKTDPSCNKWFVRQIVLKQSREIIGSISFHGVPDENGMVEIGLGIEPEFQNKGFAKEALMAMWAWAIYQPGVKSFRYTVSPDNAPSIKVIEYFGFPFTGVQIDEEDGPESIYEISVENFRKKFTTT